MTLESSERRGLLVIARRAVEAAAQGAKLERIDLAVLPAALREEGACFVTLTAGGQLRGCIGSLEARQPLALDVQEHAVDAAMNDFRFPPVQMAEVRKLAIEISVLSKPLPLRFGSAEDLLQRLVPGRDGVVLKKGARRATFLPQVWEKVPDTVEFMGMLCEKMGVAPETWRRPGIEVYTYQVESFQEDSPPE